MALSTQTGYVLPTAWRPAQLQPIYNATSKYKKNCQKHILSMESQDIISCDCERSPQRGLSSQSLGCGTDKVNYNKHDKYQKNKWLHQTKRNQPPSLVASHDIWVVNALVYFNINAKLPEPVPVSWSILSINNELSVTNDT